MGRNERRKLSVGRDKMYQIELATPLVEVQRELAAHHRVLWSAEREASMRLDVFEPPFGGFQAGSHACCAPAQQCFSQQISVQHRCFPVISGVLQRTASCCCLSQDFLSMQAVTGVLTLSG